MASPSLTTYAGRHRREVNSAGGQTYVVDDLARARRFLILGSEATYYATGASLVRANAAVIERLADTDHARLLDLIREVDAGNLAPKPEPLLFALAIACTVGGDDERRDATDLIATVCRTLDQMALFVTYVRGMRGWGPTLRRGVERWYLGRSPAALAHGVLKYGQRRGWRHADLIRMAHVRPTSVEMSDVLVWARSLGGHTRGSIIKPAELPPIIGVAERLSRATSADRVADILLDAVDLRPTWEMVPTQWLRERVVWEALLANGIPLGALVRQLGRLSAIGVLDSQVRRRQVIEQLLDADGIRKARLHPMNLLVAQVTYASGQGVRSDGTWRAWPDIVDALDAAYDLSFTVTAPLERELVIGLDVSGSMDWGLVAGTVLKPRQAAAALALTLVRLTNNHTTVLAFTSGGDGVTPLPISPRQRLDDVLRMTQRHTFGATDCALPMRWARLHQPSAQGFVVLTDNETWAGRDTPTQALRSYRSQCQTDARLAVMAMTSTGFSIADPNDPGMLDLVGCDASAPRILSGFLDGSL